MEGRLATVSVREELDGDPGRDVMEGRLATVSVREELGSDPGRDVMKRRGDDDLGPRGTGQ
jgi:hypothetical protein